MTQRTFFKTGKNGLALLLFIFFISILALIGEFFQGPNLESIDINLYKNPLSADYLNSIQKIRFKNRLVEVNVEKKRDDDKNGHWHLTAPRKLVARDETVESIKDLLAKLKIRKIIRKDSINLANFSLEPARVSVELIDDQSKGVIFSLGIINPIDNSAYITFDDKNYIYQVDIPDISLHSFSLNDFIQSSIFIFMPQKITHIKLSNVTRGGNKTARFSINKKNGNWFEEGRELNKDKVETFLEGLTLLKAIMILDEIPEEIKETINKYFNPPQFNLQIEDENGLKISADISGLVANSIDQLKINKKENVLIKSSHRSYPFVVDKEILSLLQITGFDLMSNPTRPVILPKREESSGNELPLPAPATTL